MLPPKSTGHIGAPEEVLRATPAETKKTRARASGSASFPGTADCGQNTVWTGVAPDSRPHDGYGEASALSRVLRPVVTGR